MFVDGFNQLISRENGHNISINIV